VKNKPQLLLADVSEVRESLKTKFEATWLKRGEEMALELFHDMSAHVPAYIEFLKERGINPSHIETIDDFRSLPTLDKDNYLRKYPLKSLCWDGEFAKGQWVVSSTSGSTGEPFYFPRTSLQDEYYALTAELYLLENFKIDQKTTLYIDAFAMGAWIGGLFTYEAVHRIALKGYNLSIITTGINKTEVINAVKKLGSNFDQVIIGCYPPIMKDIIDLGIESGLDWQDYNLGIVFSAEGFNEKFRDYVVENGKLNNIYLSNLNHYGSVDLGTMSHETPLSIMIRRQAVGNDALFQEIFGNINKLPTLTQYLPELFYFESVDQKVICSSLSGLPLVRYDLNDHGGVVTLEALGELFKKAGKDLIGETKKADIADTVWNLPFVYVYERSDFSVNLVGGMIYPEEIKKVLIDAPLQAYITGKFTMMVVYDEIMQPKLQIHIEMRRGKSEDDSELALKIQELIVEALLRENSEYTSNYATYGEAIWPVIKLWPYEHELHFSGKGKQKWVK
jgi:phenylacetate-CoA ligase